MKISHFILLSFLVILLLFTITTYINYEQAEVVNENAESFSRSSIVIRYSNRFQRNILGMVSGLRGYLLTNEDFFIQTYDSSIHENEQMLNELRSMVDPQSPQRKVLTDITKLNDYWIDNFATPLLRAKKNAALSDSSKIAFDKLYRTKLVDGFERDVLSNLQSKFFQFSNYEYGLREEQKQQLTATMTKTKSISFTLTAISVIAGICIAMFIAHYISSRILKMVTMANSIAEGNYDVHMKDGGKSELSQLARALNHMADILSKNISKLRSQRDELDQFAHIVSHDLKAPLRGIDNVVTWIEEDHRFALPEKVNEYLDLIKGRIVRAENLLHGILSYARISREEKVQEIVDVNELLVEVQEYIPRKPGIRLELQDDFPVLYTEKLPLLQVFTNLIGNAFKYHDKEEGTVRVYYRSMNSKFEFFVADDGPGIEKAYHDKIFVIFQTLHERDRFESTGVGLSIVKKILDERGQKIRLLSERGKGSIFSFTWPKYELNEQSS